MVVDGNGRMMGFVTLKLIDRLLAVVARLRRMNGQGRYKTSNLQALPLKGREPCW